MARRTAKRFSREILERSSSFALRALERKIHNHCALILPTFAFYSMRTSFQIAA